MPIINVSTVFFIWPVSIQVGVLRWSLSTTDESHLPLTINCWPEQEGGGQMNVSMEYELVSRKLVVSVKGIRH